MSNPRTTAIISGIAILLIGARILFGSEGISPTLAILQWVLLAAGVVGLVGSVIQMNRK
jgi:hypothetical protein